MAAKNHVRKPISVIGPSIAYVPMNRDHYALIDREDAEPLGNKNWSITRGMYAFNRKYAYMHRLVMGSPNCQVDHKNCNKLDNRRANLRLASNKENSCNRGPNSNNTSGYKGVWRNGVNWRAGVTVDGKNRHLGYFDSPQEAHLAYCNAVETLHGEFANAGKGNL